MTLKIDYSQFNTTQDNMAYDVHLLEQKKEYALCRIYQWPNHPSITLPYHRSIPSELAIFNYAHRPTGGGIVFHNPNDILFTIVAPIKDPFFPLRFKDKLQWISNQLKLTLPSLKTNLPTGLPNSAFCNSYPNPYELYINQVKVVGLAQRRFKDYFMVQGIIHTQSNLTWFKTIHSKFLPYLTPGLNNKIDASELCQKIKTQLTISSHALFPQKA
jgi:lipoate-protein ligase A